MNPFVKASQLKTKMPGYAVARMHALNHQTLQHLASHHREKFLKAFKYVQANVISSISLSRGIASCKHDGISSYFYWEKGQSPFVFHMPACAVEVGLPAAEELGAALERNGNTSALLACELAVGGARSHSYDVIRLVNSPGSRTELERLHLVTLDIIILDKQEKQGLGYDERVKLLQSLPQTQKAHCPDFQEVNGLDQLNAYYKRQIDKGEEGIVLHDLTTRVAYKIKPIFNLDLAIVGYVEGTEELTGNVVSIMGALVSGNSHQLVARVGVADPAVREKLFQELSGQAITAHYTETDSDGRPIVWVRPVKAMEINAEDAVWDDTDGKPWTNTVLQLDGDVYHYQGQGFILKPFHPTLERIREDKSVSECAFKQLNAVDLRLKQAANGKPAKVFLREAYTKAVKGNTAVRKIVAWEQEQEGYPRFVIHTVDYSPSRAKPLEEATKATDDEGEAKQFIADWKTSEITKGWARA
ncbi:MAG: hypothetical protein ACLQU3_02785 [Limisphaerales bacterium]